MLLESIATDNPRWAVNTLSLPKPSGTGWKTLHFYLDSSPDKRRQAARKAGQVPRKKSFRPDKKVPDRRKKIILGAKIII